uniref:Reverse transcriptase domain-containing protein n=1 Tax=Arion vulgaris TaxID=1028688 RepID=A0A0B7ASM2_9EUPU
MVGLKINQKKTEIMTLNMATPAPVKPEDKILPNTNTFTYLGSVISNEGGAVSDIKSRLIDYRSILT